MKKVLFAIFIINGLSEDFGNLIQKHDLTIIGQIKHIEPSSSDSNMWIKVEKTLLNRIKDISIKAGDNISLINNSNNLFWSTAIIEKESNMKDIWILDVTLTQTCILANIIAHYVTEDKQEERTVPIEEWGSEEKNETNYWGVIWTQNTPYYDNKGKYLGDLKAGSIIDVIKIVDTDKGTFVAGMIEGIKSPVVVRLENINLLPGKLNRVLPERKELRVKEAEILAKIREMQKDSLNPLNPYAAEYNSARKAYLNLIKKVEDLMDKYNKSEGATRIKYGDELRKIKVSGELNRIEKEYLEKRKKYEEWQAANPEKLSPVYKEYQLELNKIRKRIAELP